MRVNYAYTGAATQETSQTAQVLNGTTWTNSTLKEFTYTAAKKIATQIEKEWNGTTWVNLSRESNTYDAQNKLTIATTEKWSGTAWLNEDRELFSYDVQGKLKDIKNESWNITTSKWEIADSFVIKLAPNGQSATLSLTFFDFPLDVEFLSKPNGFLDRINAKIQGQTISRVRFIYNAACQVTSTNDLVYLKDAIELSPNPATDHITVQLNEVEGNTFSARIINASGQLVENKTLEGKDNHQLNVSQLPNGLYILSVQGKRWQSVKKFIVQH
jgi:hypothetical protein